MIRNIFGVRGIAILASVIVFFVTATVQAEFVLSGYLGKAETLDSDVTLKEPGGTDLTFADVSWDDDSFEEPIYYGLRMSYWLEEAPSWGIAVDFTHAKMLAELNKTVSVSGSRSGAPVSGSERLGDTFDQLEFTHGHNILTVNGMYRWFADRQQKDTFLDRLQPYVGLGLGVAIPHVEVTTATSSTEEYQVAGPAGQGFCWYQFLPWQMLCPFYRVQTDLC